MKKSELRRSEPQHLTKQPHEQVVLHHGDETILGRWVRETLEKGPRAWLLPLVFVVGGLAVVSLAGRWLARPPAEAKAWSDVMVPSAAEGIEASAVEGQSAAAERLAQIAEEYPRTSAARWALLRAGIILYEEGLRDLPTQREVGRPKLARAIELFDRVIASAPADAPEAVQAAMCKARALETRGELDLAVAEYKRVSETWPQSAQAADAAKRAEQLARPDVKKFYEDFYTLDFANVLPSPGSTPSGVPAGATIDPGDTRNFGAPLVPPLPPETLRYTPSTGTPGAADPSAAPPTGAPPLPDDLFAPEVSQSGTETSPKKPVSPQDPAAK